MSGLNDPSSVPSLILKGSSLTTAKSLLLKLSKSSNRIDTQMKAVSYRILLPKSLFLINVLISTNRANNSHSISLFIDSF